MPLLPDGRYQIRNPQTGETKIVKPEELSMYGLKPIASSSAQTQPPVQQNQLPSVQTTQQPEQKIGMLGQPSQKAQGNFISNLGTDLGENVKSLIGLPGALINIAKNPSQLPQVGGDLVKGVVNEYAGIIQDPLASAYNKPITTALDVLPFVGPAIKQVSKLSSLSKGTKAAKTAKVASKLSKVEKVAELGKETSGGLLKSEKIISTPAKQYASIFTVPTKRAKELKPFETSQKLLDYGIKGKSLDELRDVNNTVNKVLNHTKENIISNSVGEIDLQDVYGKTKETLKKSLSIDPSESERIMSILSNKTPLGVEIFKASPKDAFTLQKQIEKMGHEYLNHNTYLTSNMHDEQLGKALLQASDEIGKKLDDHFSSGDINIYKSPEMVKYLQAVSPKLAEEYLKAKTFKQLRNLQSTFVKSEKMIDLTDQASLSQGTKVASSLKELGTQTIKPVVENVSKGLLPKIQTSLAGIGDTVAGKVAKLTAKGALGVVKKLPQEALVSRNLPSITGREPSGNEYQIETLETSKNILDQEPTPKDAQSPYPWENYVSDVQRDPKNKTFYKEQYDHYNPKAEKGLNATQIKAVNLAKSGLRQLNNIEKMLGMVDESGNPTKKLNDGILSTYKFSPSALGARDWESSTFSVADAILRDRSGASLPPTEVKAYRDALFPRWGDTPEVVNQKITELRSILRDMYNQEPAREEMEDTSSYPLNYR